MKKFLTTAVLFLTLITNGCVVVARPYHHRYYYRHDGWIEACINCGRYHRGSCHRPVIWCDHCYHYHHGHCH